MIGDALAAACQDAEVLSRLGGSLGEDARARANEMRQSKPARARAMAIVQMPSPANFRGIHGSWIEAALAALPSRARADFAGNGMLRDSAGEFDPIGVWLARWASASLAPMAVAEDIIRPHSIREAITMTSVRLERWLADVGADQLAFATDREIGPGMAHVHTRIAAAPRAGNLGDRKAAIERCRMERIDGMFIVVGARTIAPHTDAITRRQLALRIHRTRGEHVLFELETWAGAAGSANWDALSAH